MMHTLRLLPAVLTALGSFCGLASAQVALPSVVFDGSGGPLLGGTVYTAGFLTVPAGQTLTMQPGAILKLSGSLTVNGTLDAQGTAPNPIRITSLADDAAGGDTNGDGAASTPQPGDWQGLRLLNGSGASVIDHAELSYHGDLGHAAVLFDGTDTGLSLTHTLVRDGAADALGMANNLTVPTISGCELRDNAGHAVQNAHINSVPGFSANTASGNGLGDVLRVTTTNLSGSVTITTDNLLGDVLVLTNNVVLVPGETLRLEAGVIAKFDGSRSVLCAGTLELAGTSPAPVVLTSLHDDGAGGDTNKNGAATTAQPGDWQGLQLLNGSAASVIDHAVFSYHGALGTAGILFGGTNTSASISHTVVRDGAADGIGMANFLTFPTISGCDLRDNAGHAVQSGHINSVPGFSANTATGNGLGDVLRVTSTNLSGSVTIATDNLIGDVLVLTNNVVVVTGETLRLEAGVVVKFEGARSVLCAGTLELAGTSPAPVVLTSLHDDGAGGDTNKNGAATTAQPGDWQGLQLLNGSAASVIDHAVFAYHGALGNAGILFGGTNTSASISHTVVRDGAADGLGMANFLTFPTISGCDLRDNAGHAVQNAHINSVPGFSANTASGNGLGNGLRITSTSPVGSVTIVADDLPGGVAILANNVFVDSTETLRLEAGVVFKFDGARNLVSAGTLELVGTAAAPVVLTSVRDDSMGGDTNADGGASAPAPGDWQGVSLTFVQGVAHENLLRHVRLRYGGALGAALLRDSSFDAVLDRVRADHGAAPGFVLGGTDQADDLVAYACRTGIELISIGAPLRRCTVAGSTFGGISGLSVGSVESSISSGNGGSNWLDAGPFTAVTYSCGTGVPAGTGNLAANPSFVDLAGGDLRLAVGSPGIDAGRPTDHPSGLDQAGFPRWLDGTLNNFKRVDMGAFEFDTLHLAISGTPTPGGSLDIGLSGPVSFGQTWLVLSLGEAELAFKYGALFTDLAAPYLLLDWPGPPSLLTTPLPADFPAPFDLMVQAVARVVANPTSAGTVSNPIRLSIE